MNLILSLVMLAVYAPITQPLSRISSVSGVVNVRIGGNKPDLVAKVGMDMPKHSLVYCNNGAKIVVRLPNGKTDKYPKVSGGGEWERVSWTPYSNPRIEGIFSARWETGGSIRDVGNPTLWLPVSGAIRPGQFFIESFTNVPAAMVSVTIELGGREWILGKCEANAAKVADIVNKQLDAYAKELENVDMVLMLDVNGIVSRSSVFYIPSITILVQCKSDLAEVDKLFSSATMSELHVARSGLLNSYGFRSEAIVELEKAYVLDPKAQDIKDALVSIYSYGGRKDKVSVDSRLDSLLKKER